MCSSAAETGGSMPAPNAQMLAQLARLNFSAKGIMIPVDWAPPGQQFPDAFAPAERQVAPGSPTELFHPATLNKYHVDAASGMSEKLGTYIDGVSSAICAAIGNWMQMAMVTGALINGPAGTLLPGGVVGPPLLPLILGQAPKTTPLEAQYSLAIANAFGTAWQAWQLGLTGMLMYPAFAAVPSPVAPPMPNIPMPLVTFASPGEAMLSPATLKGAMVGMLANPTALHAPDLFDALAQAFGTVFQMFKTTTIVQNVLGTGPVPTFAPPFVPVGPVLAGTVIPTPGVFV